MQNEDGKSSKATEQEPIIIKVKPHTYQPSKAELEADITVDATPEELRRALVRPVIMQPEE